MKYRYKYRYNYYELRPSLDSLRLGLLTSALQQSKFPLVQCCNGRTNTNTITDTDNNTKTDKDNNTDTNTGAQPPLIRTAAVKPKKVLATAVQYTAVLCNSIHTGNATQCNWVIPY